ncbi:unnamed protein product [Arabidopsis halleri]
MSSFFKQKGFSKTCSAPKCCNLQSSRTTGFCFIVLKLEYDHWPLLSVKCIKRQVGRRRRRDESRRFLM